MAGRTEAELDLVVGCRLYDLNRDAVPRDGAAPDDIGRENFESMAACIAHVVIGQRPSPAIAWPPASVEAGVHPRQHRSPRKLRFVGVKGRSPVEAGASRSIRAERVGQHGVAPLVSGP